MYDSSVYNQGINRIEETRCYPNKCALAWKTDQRLVWYEGRAHAEYILKQVEWKGEITAAFTKLKMRDGSRDVSDDSCP